MEHLSRITYRNPQPLYNVLMIKVQRRWWLISVMITTKLPRDHLQIYGLCIIWLGFILIISLNKFETVSLITKKSNIWWILITSLIQSIRIWLIKHLSLTRVYIIWHITNSWGYSMICGLLRSITIADSRLPNIITRCSKLTIK
jgi:hypothetical protein